MSLYFIAIIPPEPVKHEIRSFKEEVKEKYGVKHALKLPAHITLQKPFKANEEQEQKIQDTLANFAQEQQAFEVQLSGFGRFDQRAVFTEVKNPQPVIDLFERMQKVVTPFVGKKDRQEDIHPHLTIATRDLDRKKFPEVWKDFKDREYKASFTAANLTLLKHNGKTWDVILESEFAKSL